MKTRKRKNLSSLKSYFYREKRAQNYCCNQLSHQEVLINKNWQRYIRRNQCRINLLSLSVWNLALAKHPLVKIKNRWLPGQSSAKIYSETKLLILRRRIPKRRKIYKSLSLTKTWKSSVRKMGTKLSDFREGLCTVASRDKNHKGCLISFIW